MNDFFKWICEEEAAALIRSREEGSREGYSHGYLHAIQDIKDELMDREMFDVD